MRPLLVGMVNPLSPDPRHALWPDPPRCAGWRLWKMLEGTTGATQGDYLRAFDRTNLLSSVYAARWDPRAAREAADAMGGTIAGRVVVLLGDAVRRAFGLPRGEPGSRHDLGTAEVYLLPHPSGRCLWYNDPEHRRLAGELLGRLAALDRGITSSA